MPKVASRISFYNDYFSACLPQEWQINLSEHTTCKGTNTFIRVESEPKANTGRQLICLIQVNHLENGYDEILVIAPDIFSDEVKRIIAEIRQTHNVCLTLTECKLCCETCQKAWDAYH